MTNDKQQGPFATVWPVVVRIATVIAAVGGGAYGVDYTVDAGEERAGQAVITTAQQINKQREAILALREQNVELREQLVKFAKKDQAHDVAVDALVHLAERRHGKRLVDRTFATFENTPPVPEHVDVASEGEGEEDDPLDALEELPESYELLQRTMPTEPSAEE